MNWRRLSSWSLGILLAATSTLAAAEPTVRNLDVRGLRIGGKTTLTVDGANLEPAPRLLLPWPAAKVEAQAGATAVRAVFDVELPADVVAGTYQIRVATDEGVSAPVIIGVDHLPQAAFTPLVTAIPVALHGAIGGGTLETKIPGTGGEELTIEVESQRLGGKLRPVVHLLDPSGRQLGWSWPTRTLNGDTRLIVQLPSNGAYTVQLHDVEYGAPGPNHFRLKIGRWHHAELAFPAAIQRGQSATVELIGNSPNARVAVNATSAAPVLPMTWPMGTTASGPRVGLIVSDEFELVEQPATGGLQEIPTLPAAMNGRLDAANQQDRYRVAVSTGMKLRLEVFAERLGAPVDAVITVLDDKGATLARGDDSPGSIDAVLEYTVPANVSHVNVGVSDQLGRGGPTSIYRLLLTSAVETTTRPDFRLSTPSDRIHVPLGASAVLPVLVDRRGYEGVVRLSNTTLPPSLAAERLEIPAGLEGVLVTLSGGAIPWTQRFALRGTDEAGQRVRDVAFEPHPLGDAQPWLRNELAVAVVSPTTFSVDWAGLPADAVLPLGGKLNLPVRFNRPTGEPTPIRLTMIAAQFVPRVNGNPDLNRAIRAEKPVEIAVDKSDGELPVLAPPDLAAAAYDVTVLAELLNKDKQVVVATAVAPPRRLSVLNPVGLQMAAVNVDETFDPKIGATVKLKGRVARRGGLAGDITINAVGQPPGVKADRVVVKAGADEFEFVLVFPPTFPPGDVTGIRLSASGIPDATKPNQAVKTKDVPITVRLTAG